ncbi:MAG: class I SAM-dependent methyltransferase [Halobacteriota archaeon]|nr:class I SAM-dependent methyltransferase [Halobacteriota archaeon]
MSGRFGGYEDQEFVSEFYDLTFTDRDLNDTYFYIDYSRRSKGKTLELGCGTGRVLIPTAISGCEITGLDISSFHRDEQYNDIEMIYHISHPDGRREEYVQAFPFRYFFRYEVEHLLNLCGFRVIELFGDYDASKFSNDSKEMIFVSKKR